MRPKFKNYFLLHFIVFIWGWTAILGKAISISALPLVWHRIWIALTGIAGYLLYTKVQWKITFKDLLKFGGVGILIAIHWLCFYGSIKVSNVSVTLACFSCGTIFTAIAEPILYKRKIDWVEIMFGLIVIAAISLIFTVDTKYTLGIILSICAALISSIFSVFNGLLIKDHDARVISFYEMLTAFIFLTVYMFFKSDLNYQLISLSSIDLIYLLLLGLICTAYTFIVSVDIMKEISPYTISLTVTLESIYGIILAYFIFGADERMNFQFYIGTGIILSALIANAIVKKYRRERMVFK